MLYRQELLAPVPLRPETALPSVAPGQTTLPFLKAQQIRGANQAKLAPAGTVQKEILLNCDVYNLQATRRMTTARQQTWEGRTCGKQLRWRLHLHCRLMRQQRHGLRRHPLCQHQHRLQVSVSYVQVLFSPLRGLFCG